VDREQVDLGEFISYIMPTMVEYSSAGKMLDVEDIVREAFQQTLASSKIERDLISQAFLKATSESSAEDPFFNRAWSIKVFDELYGSPSDPSAPRYQCQRRDYLVNSLGNIASGKLKMGRLISAQAALSKHQATFHGRTSAMIQADDADESVSRSMPTCDYFQKLSAKWLKHMTELEKQLPKAAAIGRPPSSTVHSFPLANDDMAATSGQAAAS
jgi:hypothetical protein